VQQCLLDINIYIHLLVSYAYVIFQALTQKNYEAHQEKLQKQQQQQQQQQADEQQFQRTSNQGRNGFDPTAQAQSDVLKFCASLGLEYCGKVRTNGSSTCYTASGFTSAVDRIVDSR